MAELTKQTCQEQDMGGQACPSGQCAREGYCGRELALAREPVPLGNVVAFLCGAGVEFKVAQEAAPVLVQMIAADVPAGKVAPPRKATYRLLERDEVIVPSDELLDDDTVTWHPVGAGLGGAGAKWNSGAYVPMRRAVAGPR